MCGFADSREMLNYRNPHLVDSGIDSLQIALLIRV
jgi:hypothetical protein